jgi:hypothetical protein
VKFAYFLYAANRIGTASAVFSGTAVAATLNAWKLPKKKRL